MSAGGMPSAEMQELVERLNRVRGRLIASYASVEFRLADLYVKCQKLPAYSDLADEFPEKLHQRLAAIETLLSRSGPLDQFSKEIRSQFSKLREFSELRHFFVHGYGTINRLDGEPEVTFMLYQRKNRKEWSLEVSETSVDEVERVYEAMNEFATDMWHLFKRIYEALGLERGTPKPA